MMLSFALCLTLLVVGFIIGMPAGRASQRQDDRVRRRLETARNPDQRPRYRLLAN